MLFLGDGHGRQTKSPGKEDEKIACTGVREGSFLEPITQTTWKALRERVGRLSQALRTHHVQKGDRVALVASTCLDTLTVFLAVTTIGAISSSSSPDMGTTAILDRLKQIEPKYLFMEDYAVYNTKQTDLRPKMREILNGMKGVAGFRGVISQSRFPGKPADISSIPHCQTWETFISKAPSSTLIFEQLDFSDPMIIVYSSGTTGQPKCIAHSVGGIVLSGWKESTLHRNVDHTSIQLQYTTTGWIMYMSSIQLLLMGARTVMYDGSPFAHDKSNFIRLVGEQKVTHLGISPRLMQTLQTSDIAPRDVTNLDALQMVTSTGMVLSDALFEWFYAAGFPKQVHLANISGGTDIAAAFGTANPLLPVYVGGCQCIALGMAVEVFDPASAEDAQDAPPPGRPVPADGVPGDLVCTAAFPTMPTRFWGDLAPSDRRSKYHGSYFDKYDGVWTHGDFVMVHPVTKQVFLLGRADGVLNPSGVRFGSAEIYGVVERGFADSVAESLCVGQRRPQDHDESVMLFLLMKPGREKDFTPELVARLKATIRQQLSPRHVPRYVFRTPEIPVSAYIFCLDSWGLYS